MYLLKAALNAKRKAAGEPEVDAYDFLSLVKQKMKLMQMSETFLTRGVNEGFSGGEKKRNEVLQMLVLEPKLAILDETDSGLDIDALKVVAMGVNSLRDPQARGRARDALSAAARLHRARPGARAVRRTHLEVGRSLARARARAPRLRLGAGEPRRMSPAPHSAALRSFEAQWLDARGPRMPCGDLRERAMQRFLQLGLPTARDESWRYTNLRPLASQSFVDAPRAAAGELRSPRALALAASRRLLGGSRLTRKRTPRRSCW